MENRLYKIENGKKVCGVCGGLAEYFNVDPALVRIVWGVISLYYGIGIVLYFVSAFVLPYKHEI